MDVTIKTILQYISYWVLGWTIINIILPPREVFADDQGRIPRWYNVLLKLVAYYGALNLRQVSVKLYSAVQEQAPQAERQKQALDIAAKDISKAADSVETAKSITPTPDSIPNGDK